MFSLLFHFLEREEVSLEMHEQEEEASTLPMFPSHSRPSSSHHPSPPWLSCSCLQTLRSLSLSPPQFMPCLSGFFSLFRMPLCPNDAIFANRSQAIIRKYFNFTNLVLGSYGLQWRNLHRISNAELLSHSRIDMFSANHKEEIRSIARQLFPKYSNSYSADEEEEEAGKRVAVNLKSKFTEQAFNVIVETIAGKQFHGEKMMEGSSGRKSERVRCSWKCRVFWMYFRRWSGWI